MTKRSFVVAFFTRLWFTADHSNEGRNGGKLLSAMLLSRRVQYK